MKVTQINLFEQIFDKGGEIPSFITSLSNIKTNKTLFENVNSIEKDHSVYYVKFIPEYIDFKTKPSIKKLIVNQYNFKGYLLDLKGFESVNEYVKFRFKRNAGQILKKKDRLEACFDITYKKIWGKIEREEYEYLMSSLKSMLIRRFNQRNEKTKALISWEDLHKRTYGLILNKKASLFIIYNKNTPIQISLQYHYSNILHNGIPAYDIDYEKFALGNTALYEQVLWCIENNYRFLDQGYGDLEYKRRWSNYIYKSKNEIFYFENSVSSISIAYLEYLKAILKKIIKSKKLGRIMMANILKFTRKKEKDKSDTSSLKSINYNYSISYIEHLKNYDSLEVVDVDCDSTIKKITNDFLYLNVEKLDDTIVYKVITEKNKYIIKGKRKIAKICLEIKE